MMSLALARRIQRVAAKPVELVYNPDIHAPTVALPSSVPTIDWRKIGELLDAE